MVSSWNWQNMNVNESSYHACIYVYDLQTNEIVPSLCATFSQFAHISMESRSIVKKLGKLKLGSQLNIN
uniref:Uncharacterized protein n=1 Tax=Arundo donax TaxID=35708 RepID=A0A0A9U071_ARUDO